MSSSKQSWLDHVTCFIWVIAMQMMFAPISGAFSYIISSFRTITTIIELIKTNLALAEFHTNHGEIHAAELKALIKRFANSSTCISS